MREGEETRRSPSGTSPLGECQDELQGPGDRGPVTSATTRCFGEMLPLRGRASQPSPSTGSVLRPPRGPRSSQLGQTAAAPLRALTRPQPQRPSIPREGCSVRTGLPLQPTEAGGAGAARQTAGSPEPREPPPPAPRHTRQAPRGAGPGAGARAALGRVQRKEMAARSSPTAGTAAKARVGQVPLWASLSRFSTSFENSGAWPGIPGRRVPRHSFPGTAGAPAIARRSDREHGRTGFNGSQEPAWPWAAASGCWGRREPQEGTGRGWEAGWLWGRGAHAAADRRGPQPVPCGPRRT